MLRTKVRLRRRDKNRSYRIIWEEDLERILKSEYAPGEARYRETERWHTYEWDKKDEHGQFVHDLSFLVSHAVHLGLVSTRKDEASGNMVAVLPDLPAAELRFHVSGLLERSGFDPENPED